MNLFNSFTKLCSVEAKWLHADGQTDQQVDERGKAERQFSKICERA
jgi:hypothetical protein